MQTIVEGIVERYQQLEGPLLPVLHALQDELGHIPAEAVPLVARYLNLSTAEVHGVVSFYHDFRSAPAGRHKIQVCCAEACQARGARALEAHAARALALEFGATRGDAEVTLERIYCLGNCACGPSVRIGDEIFGGVDAARFDQLVGDIQLSAAS